MTIMTSISLNDLPFGKSFSKLVTEILYFDLSVFDTLIIWSIIGKCINSTIAAQSHYIRARCNSVIKVFIIQTSIIISSSSIVTYFSIVFVAPDPVHKYDVAFPFVLFLSSSFTWSTVHQITFLITQPPLALPVLWALNYYQPTM